jgi:hypothetical protein
MGDFIKEQVIIKQLKNILKKNSIILTIGNIEPYINFLENFKYTKLSDLTNERYKFDSVLILFYIEEVNNLVDFFSRINNMLEDNGDIIIIYRKSFFLQHQLVSALKKSSLKITDIKSIYGNNNLFSMIFNKKDTYIAIIKKDLDAPNIIMLEQSNI